jgi:hypothetical protein
MIYKRRDLQSLKIRSPSLLTLFLIGNVFTILLLFLVQENVELAFTGASSDAWVGAADTAGYLIVCFSEPLVLLSYSARFIRVRRIFDAQNIYFKMGVRPSDMIKRYSEPVLTLLVVTIVAIGAGTYMILASTIWGVVEKGYGALPTFALG